MTLTDSERALRTAVSEVIMRLKANGVNQAAIARAVERSEATVSRWKALRGSPSIGEIRVLAAAFPTLVDFDHLAELSHLAHGRSDGGESITAGVRILTGASGVYEAALTALSYEPPDANDRIIRHAALHLDRRDGTDPAETDHTIDTATVRLMRDFGRLMRERASAGWTIRHVTSAGTEGRVDAIGDRALGLDGPNVDVRAYAGRMPPLLNSLIVANRDVFMAVDHSRWERPRSAMLLRNRSIARWATTAFDDLFDAAPHRVRTPLGLDTSAIEGLRADVRRLRDTATPGFTN